MGFWEFAALAVLVIELERILAGIRKLEDKMTAVDDAISSLEAKVAEDVAADTSAVTLLQGLSQLLKDALAQGGNAAAQTARVQAVIDSLDASTKGLADAVVANTPAAPTP